MNQKLELKADPPQAKLILLTLTLKSLNFKIKLLKKFTTKK